MKKIRDIFKEKLGYVLRLYRYKNKLRRKMEDGKKKEGLKYKGKWKFKKLGILEFLF